MRISLTAALLITIALPARAGDCRFTLIAQYPNLKGLRLVTRDGLLVIGNPTDLYVIDANDPRNLQLRSKFYAVANAGLDHDGRFLATGNKAITSVRLFDLSDPSLPVELSPLTLSKAPRDLAVDAGHLYTVCDETIVRIFRIDPLGTHTQLSTFNYQPNWSPTFCTARDGLLLTQSGHLVSVDDPAKPTLLSMIYFYGCSNISRPVIQGGRAMVGSNSSYCNGVEINDISDPSNPTCISAPGANYATLLMAQFTPVQDLFAAWCVTFETSPSKPIITLFEPTTYTSTPIGTVASKFQATLGSDGKHLFVCDFYNGLQVFSVDPCYANCDCNASALDIDDFICFQTRFALADPYADCDADGEFTIDDFVCFQAAYALGC